MIEITLYGDQIKLRIGASETTLSAMQAMQLAASLESAAIKVYKTAQRRDPGNEI